jgi:flagellar biogenesis protein FliO
MAKPAIAIETQAHARAANPVLQFCRAAFERLTQPALWKRRRELRVCETLSLGNRNFVAVVGYQDQRFLIAGTANSISLLADVTREHAVDDELDQGNLPAA